MTSPDDLPDYDADEDVDPPTDAEWSDWTAQLEALDPDKQL